MAKRDYYEVLGVSRSSDEKEIKRAYRKLAKKYHPDTNAGNQYAEQQFKEITEAYNVLSDPEKRKLYDQFEGDGGDDFFQDIFGNMFGGGFRNNFQQGFGKKTEHKGRDLESVLTITFEEAALGCRKRISIEGDKKQTMEVRIPAGIDEGQRVRLKGHGYPGSQGMPPGDLYLKVHITEKPGYERKGMDVFTTQEIPYTTAVLGGEVLFHTLHGDVKCRIPAGTQSGSKIRLKQKGIVSMKDSSVYGDAYVTIQIAVPKTVTPQERKALQELEKLRYRNAG